MQNNHQHNLHLFEAAAQLSDLCAVLDTVHTAASEKSLETLNGAGTAELISLLREIAYTANETVAELEDQESTHGFRLVKGRQLGSTWQGITPAEAPDAQPDGGELKFVVFAEKTLPKTFYVEHLAEG